MGKGELGLAASLFCAVTLAGGPASATETTTCEGDGASISMLMGAMPVVSIAKVDMEAGTRKWSTEKAEGSTLIVVGQSFETETGLDVHLMDAELTEVIAQLRVVKASEGDFYAAGGTLLISGVGAWAVSCNGP